MYNIECITKGLYDLKLTVSNIGIGPVIVLIQLKAIIEILEKYVSYKSYRPKKYAIKRYRISHKVFKF